MANYLDSDSYYFVEETGDLHHNDDELSATDEAEDVEVDIFIQPYLFKLEYKTASDRPIEIEDGLATEPVNCFTDLS